MPRLIDADALVRDIDKDLFNTESRKCYEKLRVRRQPVIDAEPVRHGRWEQYPGPGSIRCTHCKLEFDEQKMPSARDYCPNCGAKMDLEVQEDG